MVLLVNLARVVFAPLLEPIRSAFGASAAAIGLLATLAWLGSALPRLPTGYLLTLVPRYAVILAAGTILAAAPLLAATATSLPVLWASAFLMGLSSGVYFIAAKPLLSDLFPGAIGRAVGIHGTASQLAAAGAPLFITGVLWIEGSELLLVEGWRLAFGLISVFAVVATVAFGAIARTTTFPPGEELDRDFLGAARRQWPVILSGVAFAGLAGLAWNGLFNFYVSYLVTTKPITASTARELLTVVFAAGVPAFAIAGRLADRMPYIPLLLGIVGGFAGCLLALTLASGLYGLVATSAALGFVIHGLFPTMDTYVLDSLPDAHRASAYAVFSAGIMLLNALGSVVVGTLIDVGYGYTAIFRTFAVGVLVLAALLTAIHLTIGFPTGRRSAQQGA
ncbi:MFS transporter [Halococcus saccharolyticus]|uniref:Major facilitator superfamily protein n=1 Tax=Halococcus saccharolyticus DSM 5350 TaxID=1227455 RepID=M0MPH5_9EURY|nr:MFS transporter [Halococcus saccharolyticus]EMA47273.1 major facilitator superfamily protein [Halococcus saccharolyticus DSM 5350]